MKKTVSAVIGVATLVFAAGALADITKGQEKAKQVCGACHGENGDKTLQPDYPTLAGQKRDYLVKVLNDYKSGARKNAIMGAQVKDLKPEDIRDLAEWFSSRPGPLMVKH